MTSEQRGIVLFEDAAAARLGPIALVRPVFDLVLGAMTLRRRTELIAGQCISAALVRPHLSSLLGATGLRDARKGLAVGEDAAAHSREANDSRGLAAAPMPLLINAALVMDEDIWEHVRALQPGEGRAWQDGRIVALVPTSDASAASDALLAAEGALDPVASGFSIEPLPEARLLRHPWELIAWQMEALQADLSRLARESRGGAAPGIHALLSEEDSSEPGLHIRGRAVLVEEGASIESPVALDSRSGPILIRRNARIAPFSFLEGPLLVEHGAVVLGGRVASAYLGPHCRVRGEVASSVILGWSNKVHDGFLGHAYLGHWVNLGAMTTNSNLKNNYGIVRMYEGNAAGGIGDMLPTGLTKVGCILADHVKTAIGTLLVSGTVIGLGTNLFGLSGMAPKWVPSFVWGGRPGAQPYELERFLKTAATVYSRRDRELSRAERSVLREAFRATEQERDVWLRCQCS